MSSSAGSTPRSLRRKRPTLPCGTTIGRCRPVDELQLGRSRGSQMTSLVARPPPTSSARLYSPARSCATSNRSVARPPARPPSPPARLTPRVITSRAADKVSARVDRLPLTHALTDAQPVCSRREGARNAKLASRPAHGRSKGRSPARRLPPHTRHCRRHSYATPARSPHPSPAA